MENNSMAGTFPLRRSSPLPTGSIRSRSWKTFRENFCPRFIVALPRTTEPQTKRAIAFLFSVQKNIFAKLHEDESKSCAVISYPTGYRAPTFGVQTNGSIVVQGSRERTRRENEFFFPLSFFPPSPPPQCFRLQPPRAPLEDIENNQGKNA